MQENEEVQGSVVPDKFRHIAFIGAIVLLIGAWKFALEGVFDGD